MTRDASSRNEEYLQHYAAMRWIQGMTENSTPPILDHALDQPSGFTPKNLIDDVWRSRQISGGIVPPCVHPGVCWRDHRLADSRWHSQALRALGVFSHLVHGNRVRLFTSDSVRAMLREASKAAIVERGVRVLADYLPPRVSRSADYERIFELERKLGSRPESAAVYGYVSSAVEGGA
jgi:hypothetical protein